MEYRRDQLRDSVGKKTKLVVNKPSMKLLDANGRSAMLVGAEAVDLVAKIAKKNGIGIVGVCNSTYHEGLEWYSRQIAARDLIGIISVNGGPAGVVPYGGTKAITGTNPLSYGIPTSAAPIVFDAATSRYPYGSIRIAKRRNMQLPEDAYFDKSGVLTRDPNKAHAIIPFGEHKGYAINLMLEVMTGCLVRARSGLSVKDESDLGGFFIAIDPSVFSSIKDFKRQTSKLAKEIEAVKPMSGFDKVLVPGFKGEQEKQKILKSGYLEIEDGVWEEFEQVYKKLVG